METNFRFFRQVSEDRKPKLSKSKEEVMDLK